MAKSMGEKKSETAKVTVMLGGGSNRGAWLGKLHSRRGLFLIIAAVTLVAAIAGGVRMLQSSSDDEKQIPRISYQAYSQGETERLKSSAPASNATAEEKESYYTSLMQTQYDSGDTNAALATYEKLTTLKKGAELSGDSTYLLAARIYAKKGDMKSASSQLDKAATVDQKLVDPDIKAFYLKNVETVRSEIIT